ncbi:hypothetical protein [Paractinoplanes durhamensis]|uniref:Uncharacterized protein n=1 Tax=Paractinoplanes durhamensis TaxID=113563 RepID=A0ABQ3Z762_9ACTN|nr:hypothetical protein [Actinoplanes durhamensis]GIE05673.1 hypothetical protein Adu01nite_70230 [Actinoplanes durhamensis]
MAPDGYLRRVLAGETRAFEHRSTLERLLGLSTGPALTPRLMPAKPISARTPWAAPTDDPPEPFLGRPPEPPNPPAELPKPARTLPKSARTLPKSSGEMPEPVAAGSSETPPSTSFVTAPDRPVAPVSVRVPGVTEPQPPGDRRERSRPPATNHGAAPQDVRPGEGQPERVPVAEAVAAPRVPDRPPSHVPSLPATDDPVREPAPSRAPERPARAPESPRRPLAAHRVPADPQPAAAVPPESAMPPSGPFEMAIRADPERAIPAVANGSDRRPRPVVRAQAVPERTGIVETPSPPAAPAAPGATRSTEAAAATMPGPAPAVRAKPEANSADAVPPAGNGSPAVLPPPVRWAGPDAAVQFAERRWLRRVRMGLVR